MNKKITIGIIVAAVVVAGAVTAVLIFKAPATPKGNINNPAANTNAGIANPASVNCVGKGGSVQIKTAADGSQTGYCIFNDGSSCEEWAFMRGECQPGAQTVPSGSLGIKGSPDQSNFGTPLTPVLNFATDATLGSYLVADNGLTLYYYAKDTTGVSNCTGACAVNWPPYVPPSAQPYLAEAGVNGVISFITRADGTLQLTYNGLPLYFWKGDLKAGDTAGQGVGGVWYVVKP